ncbi:unnamed protein product [Thelazia callipaeda]|uniref:Dystrophin-like protein 1 n=1 Tax=Thelazia callipaeda TaxID=103827 RepID=A0A0N5DBF8_THECL|nr:unnamed protein product [Thelazia callipaeda]
MSSTENAKEFDDNDDNNREYHYHYHQIEKNCKKIVRRGKKARHKLVYVADKMDILIGSVVSVEGDHVDVEEKLSKVSEASRSPSPMDDPPPPAPATPAYLQRRHSIFSPRQAQTSDSVVGTCPPSDSTKDCAQPSTSGEQQKTSPIPAVSVQQSSLPPANPANITGNVVPAVSGSSTLPHSMTWAPQMATGQFQSMQSLDQRGMPTLPFYPMPTLAGPSTSVPYGLSSPYLLSPYGTMQFPRNTSEQQIPATNPNIPGSPHEGQDLTAYQLSLSLDQYNQHLIRSQLDQAQQTAQVASCQVQLLRDQLTSETTARIEAQSRTHQLLNANRELLEQVQVLVQKLQTLESRLANEIHEHISQPSTSKGQRTSSTLPLSFKTKESRPSSQMTTHSMHEYTGEAKVPGPPPIDPSKPYQLQSLADIRAGSLPPQVAQSSTSNSAKNRRAVDDSGVRTEPESGAEDTTDYSSSDQYEKMSSKKGIQQRPMMQPPELGSNINILMSNPQVMSSLPPSFPTQAIPSGNYIPNYLVNPSKNQNSDNIKDIDEQEGSGLASNRRIKDVQRSKVLGGETIFNRMSFNPKLWEGKRKEIVDSGEGAIVECTEENQIEQMKKSDEKRKSEESVSTARRRSERLERFRRITEDDVGTSFVANQIEQPFDARDVEWRDTTNVSRRKSVASLIGNYAEPASLRVATAMYPPRQLKFPLRNTKESFRKLSVDTRDDNLHTSSVIPQQAQLLPFIGNGPVIPSTSGLISRNHAGMLDEKEKSQKIGSGGASQMLVLQEALKQGLASTRKQLRQTSETLDGMKNPLKYLESQKPKLSDPAVLAKLTKLPSFRSTFDYGAETCDMSNLGDLRNPSVDHLTTTTEQQNQTHCNDDTGQL